MDTLRPKNWAKFQHYKDRCPPWIKLHREILDDFDYSSLPLASKALAPLLWLLAAEHMQGEITADPARLAHRLRWSLEEVVQGLKPLLDKGFFVSDSEALATCLQTAIPETETETKVEKRKADAPQSRGARLPADWKPTEQDIAYAVSKGVNWQLEAENFADFWHAKAGKDACKVDWTLTWKTWVRRAPQAKPAPSAQPVARSAKEAMTPSETPLQAALGHARQQNALGVFGTGTEGMANYAKEINRIHEKFRSMQ